MEKEELKGTKIWFGDDIQTRNKATALLFSMGIEMMCGGQYITSDYKALYIENRDSNRLLGYGSDRRVFNEDDSKEITPSQLLGETEEWGPKVGDWVYIIQGCDYKGRVFQIKEGDLLDESQSPLNYKVQGLGNKWSVKQKQIRPARPEEIPQEEVEYVECINNSGNTVNLNTSKVYRVVFRKPGFLRVDGDEYEWSAGRFKPSTREAYEAQQKNQFKIHIEAVNNSEKFIGLFNQLEKVNKCSTIYTNQNECKNESGIILPRKSYDFPRGKRKEGSKIQLTGRVFPSKGRS